MYGEATIIPLPCGEYEIWLTNGKSHHKGDGIQVEIYSRHEDEMGRDLEMLHTSPVLYATMEEAKEVAVEKLRTLIENSAAILWA